VLAPVSQAPQVLPPPSGFGMNDVAVSPDQTTVIVTMTNQTTVKTDLFVTTDLVNYAPLTTGARPPTF
jgi:DNA-binding beta-propeller fold protein YncE